MDDKKKNTVKNLILTSSIVAGSVIGLSSLNAIASDTFRYSELGSGGELRSELLNNNSSNIIAIDLTCGEDGKKMDAHKDSKVHDAKCGEGNCGEDKADMKKSSESMSVEAKSGEQKTSKKSKSDKKTKKNDGNKGN